MTVDLNKKLLDYQEAMNILVDKRAEEHAAAARCTEAQHNADKLLADYRAEMTALVNRRIAGSEASAARASAQGNADRAFEALVEALNGQPGGQVLEIDDLENGTLASAAHWLFTGSSIRSREIAEELLQVFGLTKEEVSDIRATAAFSPHSLFDVRAVAATIGQARARSRTP